MANEYLFFGGFLFFIFLMLLIDLGIFNKKDHTVKLTEASIISFLWVSLAASFYFILFYKGHWLHNIKNDSELAQIATKHFHNINLIPNSFLDNIRTYNENLALEFLTGYIVEYALSIDNIFVIILIFNAFKVEEKYYHRVLFWGIIGAVIMRFFFIFIGTTLITKFDWIFYLFGFFLIYTGIMLLIHKNNDEKVNPNDYKIVKFASKYLAVYPHFVNNQFFIRKDKKLFVTSLFLVLLVIELTDLVFAFDSIPAIFAITKDPYIVFFSNIFAIVGLRSMFFLLVNVIHKFYYLKYGLVVLLIFIGTKMLAHHWLIALGFTIIHSLIIILTILSSSIIISLIFPKKNNSTR